MGLRRLVVEVLRFGHQRAANTVDLPADKPISVDAQLTRVVTVPIRLRP
jgi:hypothetical protein